MANDRLLYGVVADLNEKGLKIDGDWFNFTKEEWRESPWHSPTVGDTVEVKLRGDFIRAIKLEQAAPEGAAPAPRSRQFSSDSVALSPRYLALKLATERFSLVDIALGDLASLKVAAGNMLAVADDFYEYLTQQDGEA